MSEDLTKCPCCGGPADNGHDRCYPPNPYFCKKCNDPTPQEQNGQLTPEVVTHADLYDSGSTSKPPVAVGLEPVMSMFATEVECLRARDKWNESQVAALQAELAECKRDAERYRYWRDNHGWTGYFDDGASNEDSPKAVDAAIDAAMKEGE